MKHKTICGSSAGPTRKRVLGVAGPETLAVVLWGLWGLCQGVRLPSL